MLAGGHGHQLSIKTRVKGIVYGIIFSIISLYVWFTLDVNSLKGFYRLGASIPLFFVFKSFSESLSGAYKLREGRSFNKVAFLIYLGLAFMVALVSVFV